MKYNWKPTRPAFLDFETQSEHDLPESTASKYMADPTTRALTCVVKHDGKTVRMGPYLSSADKEYLTQLARTHTIVAHNAPFDAMTWERVLKLPEAEWYDTLPPTRAAGFPGKLDDVGKILTGEGKDKNGRRLVEMLCIVRNGRVPAPGPAHQMLLDYNERDVELLETVYHRTLGFGEPDVMTVDRTINDRGVPLNEPMLDQLIQLYATNKEKLAREFDDTTGGVKAGSPKQVLEWLRAQGFDLPNSAKAAMKDLLSDPSKFYVGDGDLDAAFEVVKEAVEQRRELVRVGAGKALAAKQCLEPDGRIRDQFVIYGAGPGRWSGRRLQLHNMPLKAKGVDALFLDPTYEGIVAAARAASEKLKEKVYASDVLNAKLRHLVRADNLVVADYGSVEARCLAWIAGEGKMLHLYADPHKSVYLDMGAAVFGREITKNDAAEYSLAKALVLGCGYGMSGAKFNHLCLTRNVSVETLKRAGLNPAEAVKVYRRTYPMIPKLWNDFHEGSHLAVKGVPVEVGKCKLYMKGPDLYMELPSGRPIVYRNARVEPRVPGYCKLYGMEERYVPTIIYDNARGGEGFLYGSKITENACQAICRDLLANSLVNCEQEGLNTVLHVHDEIGCETDDRNLEKLLTVMSDPPSWASGFPVVVEGGSGPVWTKQSDCRGYRYLNAILGRTFGGKDLRGAA